jgi:hypothetical protein
VFNEDLVELLPGLVILNSLTHGKDQSSQIFFDEILEVNGSHVGVDCSQLADRGGEQAESLCLDDRVVIKLECSLDSSAENAEKRKGLIVLSVVDFGQVISSGTLVANLKWLSR